MLLIRPRSINIKFLYLLVWPHWTILSTRRNQEIDILLPRCCSK